MADPADAVLDRVQCREQQVAFAGDLPSACRGSSITRVIARAAFPPADRRTQQSIDGLAFGLGRLSSDDVKIHY